MHAFMAQVAKPILTRFRIQLVIVSLLQNIVQPSKKDKADQAMLFILKLRLNWVKLHAL